MDILQSQLAYVLRQPIQDKIKNVSSTRVWNNHKSVSWRKDMAYISLVRHTASDFHWQMCNQMRRSSQTHSLSTSHTHEDETCHSDEYVCHTPAGTWHRTATSRYSLPISLRQISSYKQLRRYLKNHLFGIWESTAQRDAWFSSLYKYSYLLT